MVTNFGEKANFLWSVADLIRDTFKRGRYQDVILPFTVLRRIDSVLEPTKDQVLKTYNKYKDEFDTLPDGLLRKASGYVFYNTSPYTFERLLADPANLAKTWVTAQEPTGPVQKAHPAIHAALQPAVDCFKDAGKDEQESFRGALKDYVRLYGFLSQILTFVDPDLEKLYLFARLLWRVLPYEREPLPLEILGEVDLETYALKQTHNGQIELERGPGELEPQGPKGEHLPSAKEMMALSEIVHLLNEHFGTKIPPKEGERFIALLQQRLAEDQALAASVRVNPRDKARLTFDHVVNDRIQDMVDVSFKFYKLLNDDPAFAEFFQDMMFTRYLRMSQAQPGV